MQDHSYGQAYADWQAALREAAAGRPEPEEERPSGRKNASDGRRPVADRRRGWRSWRPLPAVGR